MVARRRTTINHAFAAAIAPSDIYDERVVSGAIALLGQKSECDLECAYCGSPAETWDHVFATVRDSQFSGFGHRLGNLLPCCKPCNSRKGNKPWASHLSSLNLGQDELADRRGAIERYLATYLVCDCIPEDSADRHRLDEIRRQVLSLLEEGDLVATRIRTGQTDVGQECNAQVEV